MLKKLSILQITNNYRPYKSGVANALEQLHTTLLSLGHNSHIVTLDFLGQREEEKTVTRIFSPIRFRYKKKHMAIPFMPYYNIKKIVALYKPDIIHVHHPFLLGRIGLSLGKKHGIPVVFTYHTQYEKYVYHIPLPEKITHGIVVNLVGDFCQDVDGIVAPSTVIKNMLDNFLLKKPIIVQPSGIDELFFSTIPKKLKAKDNFNLLSVSRFAQEKNIEFLLRVMKDLPKFYTLSLVGYGEHEQFLRFYAYQRLGLSQEQVSFYTNPTKEELIDHYKKCDLFIFASTTETQGLVLAEAMASGTPVVALLASGTQDIIKDGYNGFLIENEQGMQEKIMHTLENSIFYDQLSCNAFTTAQEYCSKKTAKKMLDFYWYLLMNRLRV